jgi:hypothetical protein
MHKIYCITIVCFFSFNSCFAQPLAFPNYVKIENVENYFQIDSLKNLYRKSGFALVKESMLDMYNNYESAIIMPLKEGTWYRAVFIGSKSSKVYQVRLFDYEDKKVITANQKPKDEEGNIVSFDYIPKFTEFHAMRILQINKVFKKPFGYILLFKMKINL